MIWQVLPPSAHASKASVSKFLLSWLFQHEHEHRQWSAAISLGVISSCLHVTDHKQKFQNINALLEVLILTTAFYKSLYSIPSVWWVLDDPKPCRTYNHLVVQTVVATGSQTYTVEGYFFTYISSHWTTNPHIWYYAHTCVGNRVVLSTHLHMNGSIRVMFQH